MVNELALYTFKRATIALNGNLSGAVDINGWRIVGVAMPDAWTAADIAFQIDPGDGTFRKVYDNEGAYIKLDGVAADGIYLLCNTETAQQAGGGNIPMVGAKIKVHSIDASDETDEAQGAEAIVGLLCVPA